MKINLKPETTKIKQMCPKCRFRNIIDIFSITKSDQVLDYIYCFILIYNSN